MSNLQSLISSAQTAIADSDWSTAENKLLQAQAELVAMANSDDGRTSLEWDRRTVNDLLANVRSKLSASASSSGGGIQRTSVTYQRVGASECD